MTARAIAYRSRAATAPADLAMGVVVQQMVAAQAAGVFMTLNPANGDRSKIMIESVWGLGEPLVSGEVNPDRFLIDKVTGQVVRQEVAVKTYQAIREPRASGGTTQQAVDDEWQERPSLGPTEVAELLRVARRIEQRAGTPQDGEFAVTGGEPPHNVWILQSRPETVWTNRSLPTVAGRRSALEAVVGALGTP